MLCRVCRYLSPGFPSPTTSDNPLAPLGVSNLLATDLLCAGEVCIAKPCFTGRCYRLSAVITAAVITAAVITAAGWIVPSLRCDNRIVPSLRCDNRKLQEQVAKQPWAITESRTVFSLGLRMLLHPEDLRPSVRCLLLADEFGF